MEKTHAAQIRMDRADGRLTLCGEELHCGQVLQVLLVESVRPQWRTVRLEMGADWYLVGYQDITPAGLWARY